MSHATSNGRGIAAWADDAVALLAREKELSPQTLDRLEALMRQFTQFLEFGLGVRDITTVSTSAVERWVTAPTTDGLEAGVSIQYFRRLAVRTMFRSLRSQGVEVGDPTVDLALPSRRRAEFRPLDDEEVELCRAACLGSGKRNRSAAVWALGEATARTGELPHIRRADIDPDTARVWISGNARTFPRWGHLTGWGASQLAAHLSKTPGAASDLVLYAGDPSSALAQSSAVGAISRTLTRAGLGDAADVRPSSLPAWAGRRIFDDTGRIDVAARRLGMRSLDRAAVLIGWDWATSDE